MAGTLSKVGTGARLLLSAEMWRVVLGEARQGSRDVGQPPEVREVGRDEAAGLRQVEVGGDRYWLPLAMDLSGLAPLHLEVFCERHPHYYEHAGCRVRPGDVVVDAGASEGFFTRFALRRGARVIAVEPWGPMVEALRRTFADEIAAGSVVVEQAVLSDGEGEAVLAFDPETPWGATASPGVAADAAPGRETVRRTTLDALIARSAWGRCDFLKMDVEGAEREVVAGAAATLRRDRPCLSVAVYHHPTGYLDIRRDLRSAGLGYEVAGKGLQRRRGLYIPVVLHAWSPRPDAK
jgi:FkbM family methyltransferase